MKIIFVTSCKPISSENIKIIQENSINSWRWLNCQKEIYVFNNEDSIKKLCNDLNIHNVTDYESSDLTDLPTWRTMSEFAKTKSNSSDYILWVNSDIVFDDSLVETLETLENSYNLENFVLVGKRKNWDNFFKLENKNDIEKIVSEKNGSEWEIDYFLFKKNNFNNLPKFFIARMKFDNFLLSMSINEVNHTIDVTETANSYHHTHKYGKDSNLSWNDFLQSNSSLQSEYNLNQINCGSMNNLGDCRYQTKKIDNKIVLIRK